MWFLYVPLVVLILVGAGSAFVGFLPGILGAVVLACLLGVLAALNRAKNLQLDKVDSPGAIAPTQAAYQPQTDLSSTPPGGSTGT